MRLALPFLAAASVATPVLAQDQYDTDPPPVIELSGGASVMTDYRFRGISRSDGDVAGKAWGEIRHASGFYGGVVAHTIEGPPAFSDIELEPYAGWSGPIFTLVDLDVGVTRRINLGADFAGPTDYWEPYVGVVGSLGPARVRLGVAYAPEQDSLGGRDNLYLSANAEASIPLTRITLDAHVGRTDGALSAQSLFAGTGPTGDSYTDWSLGARYTFLPFLSAKLEYVGNDAPEFGGLTDDTIVGRLMFEF